MAKSPASINLLGRKTSRSDVFLNWALTTGRFIIILTETIALAAFAYRFTLDRQIIDLHDQIKQKQAIVAFYTKDELKFRSLQTKLSAISTLGPQGTVVTGLLDDVFNIAKGKIILQSLTVKPANIEIIGDTPTLPLMASFVNDIKHYPGVRSVNVVQVESHPDTGQIRITFEVTLTGKKGSNGG